MACSTWPWRLVGFGKSRRRKSMKDMKRMKEPEVVDGSAHRTGATATDLKKSTPSLGIAR
jgi:hypothetical protein